MKLSSWVLTFQGIIKALRFVLLSGIYFYSGHMRGLALPLHVAGNRISAGSTRVHNSFIVLSACCGETACVCGAESKGQSVFVRLLSANDGTTAAQGSKYRKISLLAYQRHPVAL